MVFIDVRDHFGITQLVFTDQNLAVLEEASHLKYESVITIIGKVIGRTSETVNDSLNTGMLEILVNELPIESNATPLPFLINTPQETPEETRLKYRFLDLRYKKLHNNMIRRPYIIAHLRQLMASNGCTEFGTPILTAISP